MRENTQEVNVLKISLLLSNFKLYIRLFIRQFSVCALILLVLWTTSQHIFLKLNYLWRTKRQVGNKLLFCKIKVKRQKSKLMEFWMKNVWSTNIIMSHITIIRKLKNDNYNPCTILEMIFKSTHKGRLGVSVS